MVLEERILPFYLRVFSILLITIFYFFYIFFIKETILKNEYFLIEKNGKYKNIIDQNIIDYPINLFFYKTALRVLLLKDTQIHYGKFKFDNNLNFVELLKAIKKPSNLYEKITIVEGWSKNDLNKILSKNFQEFNDIEYTNVIADTYMFTEGSSFIEFKKQLEKRIFSLKEKFKSHKLLNKFSFKEIMIIGSMLEKEGLDYNDKRKIYSVIMNRLNNKMKLQIDATVIFSITKGYKSLDRKLTFEDLMIKDSYNTYFKFGLPPEPISYVGYKTIELIFEDYKTDYLFYFYNSLENRHVFSLNYKDHLVRLNEYRSKK